MSRPRPIDAAVTIAVTGCTLLPAVRPDVGWAAILLALCASVPVLWRRRAIVPVTIVVGFATTGLSLVERLPPLPYGMLVCTYTFAALGSAPLRRWAVGLTAIGVTASLILAGDGIDSFGYVGMAYASAYALGAGARASQNQVAMLREQSRRLDRERAAATERERVRIARDMHDVLAHAVTMVAVAAEAGPVTVRSDPDRAEMLFGAISATAREALGQIRRTVGAMRAGEPATTDDTANLAAVPGLIARARAAGVDARLVEQGDVRRTPADVSAAVYRIVQESLTNTVRHGRASSVQVGLSWSDVALGVEIRDDGSPGPRTPGAGRADGDGYGLLGMRERAVACGGTLTADHRPEGGFVVRADLPLA